MDKLNALVERAQQISKSQQLSPTSSLLKTSDYSISAYTGTLTTENVINQVWKLKCAFPALPAGFYDILMDRVKERGFSDERFNDAINNLIDTCTYPHPTIANIISWDAKIKLYTYDEILNLVGEFGTSIWTEYKVIIPPIDVPVRVWASVIDIKRFNLTLENHGSTTNNNH